MALAIDYRMWYILTPGHTRYELCHFISSAYSSSHTYTVATTRECWLISSGDFELARFPGNLAARNT